MRVVKAASALGAGAFLLVSALTIFPTAATAATATSSTPSIDAGAVTLTKTVTRNNLEADGTTTQVDSRNVTVSVSQTKDLHSRQPLTVSWSGAHPTGAVISDPNSSDARNQEYPFVLMECRGVDSTTVPLAQQARPETCWTGTSRERDVADTSTGFGPWRLDRYETAANRQAKVGIPDPYPTALCGNDFNKGERWVHFIDVKGRDFGADGGGCPAVPAESTFVDNANQPPNTTYAATLVNGTGSTKFTTWTSEDNASLGCGGTVKCTLEIIPIMGISCDVTAAALPVADQPTGTAATKAGAACEAKGEFAPGAPRIGGAVDLSVTGSLWFSASNWRNRIAVPLSFAPLANVCDLTSSRPGVDIYGSELATQLTGQWRPAFCLSSTRTPFKHVQIGEPQAANLLATGNVDGAFLNDPPSGGFQTPTVVAPVALTGFAISYAIDDKNGDRYTKLKLTPRLLAKLLTNSYPGISAVQDEDAAIGRNPLEITQDPEFEALNPGIKVGVSDSPAAAVLLNLSSDSDVELAMSSYIAQDPDAQDFLEGIPDPWGMVVNPAYSTNPHVKNHFTLPVNNWPLRDAFEPKKFYESGANPCLTVDPVPIFPLMSSPTARLANISQSLQFAISNVQLQCQTVQDAGTLGSKLVAEGRQAPGSRFVIGVTSLGDASRYDLDTAALQTYVSPDADAKFTSAAGRTFTGPTEAALAAGGKLLKPDDERGTWDYPYDQISSSSANAAAYPGTMLLSLAAPTTGLDKVSATGISQLLSFADGPGQQRGFDVGQMPPGYLPLTKANGLSAEATYTRRAAAAVLAQKSGIVNPSGAVPPSEVVPTATPTAEATTSAAPSTGTAVLPSIAAPTTSAVAIPTPAVARTTPPSAPAAVALGITGAVSSALASQFFPLLLLVGILTVATAMAILRFGQRVPA